MNGDIMLPKDIQTLLEGVHFFLLEDLKSETLSGKVECNRRGLLLQLEALRELYPLQFTTKFDPIANIRRATLPNNSLHYINGDQLVAINGANRRISTSSGSTNYGSGSSNESSIGYSGDGEVMAPNTIALENATSDFSSENYEEFDDVKEFSSQRVTTGLLTHQKTEDSTVRRSYDDNGTKDDSLVELDLVAFKVLIAKCDHYGALLKRSKGLLKILKSFLGVLTGSLLYLYQKETDDRQRKVIELTGYSVRNTLEEIRGRSYRPREFGFELIRPGRKTHMFYLSTRKEKDEWVRHLRNILFLRKTPLPDPSGRLPLNKVAEKARVDEEAKSEGDMDAEDEELDEDDFDDDEDFYEELGVGSTAALTIVSTSVCHTATVTAEPTHCRSKSTLEISQRIPLLPGTNIRIPPERPPPPQFINGKRLSSDKALEKRPLPKAPEEIATEEENQPDEIYCEIDEDVSQNFSECSSPLSSSRSLSQEIFDTINERVTPLPEGYPQYRFTNKELLENYDVPNEVSVPVLPPKNIFTATIDEAEESEYKIPPVSNAPENMCHILSISENLYLSPPINPVPILNIAENLKNYGMKESVIECSHSVENEIFQIRSASIKICKPIVDTNMDDVVECGNTTSEVEDSKAISRVKHLVKNLNHATQNQIPSETIDVDNAVTQKGSVKDIVAKINQTHRSQRGSVTFRDCNSLKIHEVHVDEVISIQEAIKDYSPKPTISKEILTEIDHKEYQSDNPTAIIRPLASNGLTRISNSLSTFCGETDINNRFCLVKEGLKTNSVSNRKDSNLFIAKFPFVSDSPESLNFSRGDEITFKGVTDDYNVWRCTFKGRDGLVHKEYLRKKEDENQNEA